MPYCRKCKQYVITMFLALGSLWDRLLIPIQISTGTWFFNAALRISWSGDGPHGILLYANDLNTPLRNIGKQLIHASLEFSADHFSY
jgi:hypothetical protein